MFDSRTELALFLLFLTCAGCANSSVDDANGDGKPEEAVDIAQIAREYKTLKLMTPETVFVNPTLAMLCVGPSKEMVDAVQVDYGPHANCGVRIYMNEIAAVAFEENAKYPVGAVIVKEKQMLGYRTKDETEWAATGSGVGGMIKRAIGFSPDGGDWEYFYFENTDAIESGRLDSCIQCHAKAKNTDFVYGSWNSEGENDDNAYSSGY